MQFKLRQAIAFHQRGQSALAEGLYREVLTVAPMHFDALHMLGVLNAQRGNLSEAIALLDKAVAVNRNSAAAYSNRGNVLEDLGRWEEALASYNRSISLRRDSVEAYNNRGNVLRRLNRWDEALANYQRAIALKADYAEAHYGLGCVLRELGRGDEALATFERALELRPDFAEAHFGRGNALRDLERWDDSLASYASALALRPDYAEANINRALVLQDLKRWDEALASFHRVISAQPDCASAHYNLSLCELLLGDFSSGWARYAYRWRRPDAPAKPEHVRDGLEWPGQPFEGTLLAWGEQGLGDQILYASMVPELAKMCRELVVSVEPRLVPLFRRSFPDVTVNPSDAPVNVEYDLQASMGGVGRFLRKSWQDFPEGRRGYLRADPFRTAQLRAILTREKKKICGISWVSKIPSIGRQKSIALRDLLPVLTVPGYEFVDLQYGDTSAEITELADAHGITIRHLQEVDTYGDIDALASLIDACDVVVTISNTTAHLAGALGKITYVMPPFANGLLWYWHERDDSPWYPPIKLFRQSAPGDWEGVVTRVAAALRQEQETT